ncbi:MAG: tRNA-dihydrouridine synthase family protein [Candidatus Lokiarchaeota archaeon]|nr:tRNA-dihydrouridine synthase family protein [Candidatus Lokiarchaeota archaeon]
MKLFRDNPGKNLFLAPLQNVTTAPFRNFCRQYFNIGLVCTPMIYMKRLSKSPKSVSHELHGIEKERPISVQIIGNDPKDLIASIDFLESYKFDILDINAGCPSKRALNSKEGGYLLKNLPVLESLLNLAVKHSSRPISLKTRIGFDNTNIIEKLGRIINESGIIFVTVHARTVLNKFDDKRLDLEKIKNLKKIIKIPLIGNGDINDPVSAKKFLEKTNVDGLMIGRGAMGRPEIFTLIHDYLINDKLREFNNNLKHFKHHMALYEIMINDFLEGAPLRYSSEHYKFAELKRNAIWFTKYIEDSSSMRVEFGKAKILNDLKTTLDLFV